MRHGERAARLRHAALLAAALLALGLGLLAASAGCGELAQSTPTGGRSALVTDLASRLSHADTLTYTAVYQLPGGARATVAQAQGPLRTAYRYPGGVVTVTPAFTADCRTQRGATTCTLTGPPEAGSSATAALFTEVGSRGLVGPDTVTDLLTAAALDPTTSVRQHDNTIAGEHASCVDITTTAAASFSACITTDGLLGSFTGQIGGEQVDITLDRVTGTAAPDAFDLPAGARKVDHRPS